MARDMEEVKELGREMSTMRTNKELKEKGKVPDPKQQR